MSKAKVIQQKSSWIDRFSVKVKLRVPSGITLTQGETEALADIQQKDVSIMKDNQQEILAAIGVTRSIDLASQIKKSSSVRSTAVSTYKKTKDPIKKREWARRIVVADNTHKSLSAMRDKMQVTRERLEMIKGDIEMQIIEAEAKVAETRAYAKAGKQLRLAGDTLVNARIRAKDNAIEYSNLEITMEGAEKMINDSEPENLLEQANMIAGVKPDEPNKG